MTQFEIHLLNINSSMTSQNGHGRESCDILNVYSDRPYKKIDHYYLNTQ